SHDPVQHTLAHDGAGAVAHAVHAAGDVRRDGVAAVVVSHRIGWLRGGDHWRRGETGECARYSVAGHVADRALTALHPDGFVVPRNDHAVGVKANLLIADRGVAVVFAGCHFIVPAVLHADGFADSLREQRRIERHRVGAIMAVTAGALNKYDLNIR